MVLTGYPPAFSDFPSVLTLCVNSWSWHTKKRATAEKKSISCFQQDSLGWRDVHAAAFKNLQKELQNSTRLAHRNFTTILCVFTDGSNRHWAVGAT